jgi:hypothetical protein
MFHAPYGGSKPQGKVVLTYWAVFVEQRKKPIALFEKYDVAVMFKETMTDGECIIRPYDFRSERTD